MNRKIPVVLGTVWISALLGWIATPEASPADIYSWQDESGTTHFTDTLSNIPEKYRSRKKTVLQGPSGEGRPGMSTLGSSSPPSPGPSAVDTPPSMPEVPPPQEAPSREAEQLRSRIAAKERFIEGIDRKRSNTLNPLGNRFVSPEDLELYKKYSEELPLDRQRLKELETGRP